MSDITRRNFCMNFIAVPVIATGAAALDQKDQSVISDLDQEKPKFQNEEKTMNKVGIIICDRYNTCAGGKCLKSLKDREGGFARYKDEEVELVGFTTCGGCPGGNVESSPEEMIKNGAEIIHLATGFIVGYPPCPFLEHFTKLIPEKYGIKVVVGTHPIPEKYYLTHNNLKTWDAPEWKELLKETVCDKKIRLKYN